jgi:alpha-D-ribose 1-methylphosphonate 5-triphosphate synthase subunit PhnG
MDHSRVTAEGSADAVRFLGEFVAARLPVKVLRTPAAIMTMVTHVDPLLGVPFSLGEAFATECEVEVDGRLGYGCCLGRSEERALCAAIVDAIVGTGHPLAASLLPLLEAEEARIRVRWKREEKAAAMTKVDFEVR